MSAEGEKQLVLSEWKQRALDDIESAEILLAQSDNHEIVAYHCHQAIEKIIKYELLRLGKEFRFIHDLNALFQQLNMQDVSPEIMDDISYINSLYPILRYPSGDEVTKEQAQKCLAIAKRIFNLLSIPLRL